MTATERLHRLVDVLPERDKETAARLLEALAARPETVDRLALALALASEDDEPVTDEDRAAIEQGRSDYRAGHGVSMDELLRERSQDRAQERSHERSHERDQRRPGTGSDTST